jgi:hypothetical protein
VTVDLFTQFALDGVEQAAIDNGSLFASEDLTLEGHLPDIEAIAQEMNEPTARERNATVSPVFRVRVLVTMPFFRRSAISRLRLPSLR